MRSVHVVQKTGDKPWPDLAIIVQARCKQRFMGEADDVGHLELDAWTMAVGRNVGKHFDWREEKYGMTADQWYADFAEVTKGYNRVWIYSWQAREVMAALGFWDMVADGHFYIAGHDVYNTNENVRDKDGRRNGLVILDGPPTIVAFGHDMRDTSYIWLDPQNYGVKALDTYVIEEAKDDPDDKPLVGESWMGDTVLHDWVHAVADWLCTYLGCLVNHNLGAPEHTAATQAMSGFRGHYMCDRIEIHDSDAVIGLERQALYGGRCEARFIGELHAYEKGNALYERESVAGPVRYGVGTITQVDVNSLYPSVACGAFLPVRLRGITKHVGRDTLIAALKTCAVVAWVKVRTDKPLVPLRHDKLTLWPTGEFDTVLCGPELQLLLDHGCRVNVIAMAVYESRPIYRNWVDTLYAARILYRKSGDNDVADCLKCILNASFGKWAQLSRRWVDVPESIPIAPYHQWYQMPKGGDELQSWRSLGWNVQRQEVQGETNESFPAITAYIHSFGRVRLWHLMQVAGPSNVYYYDTDSLFVNQLGLMSLEQAGELHEHALGKCKIKGQYSHVRFMGRQAYVADGKLTLSGAASCYRQSSDVTAEVLHAAPIQHYLFKGKPPGLDRHIARVRMVRPYLHGHVAADGTVTPPEFRVG